MRLPCDRVRRFTGDSIITIEVHNFINVAALADTWDLVGACWVANAEFNTAFVQPECIKVKFKRPFCSSMPHMNIVFTA